MIQDPFAIFVVLVGIILVSLKIIDRVPYADKLSPVMWILMLGALASNLGLIPTDAPLYRQLTGFAVPFAVAMILFQVKLGDIRLAGKPMIVAFAIASVGTMVGVLVAGVVLEPFLHDILGENSWKLAGPYTGTYIGGSLNFFALWDGLDIKNPDLFAAANAVDNITLLPLFGIWILVPTLLGKWFKVGKAWREISDDEMRHAEEKTEPKLIPSDIVLLVFMALVVVFASDLLKEHVINLFAPQLPSILIVTTLALIIGQIPYIARKKGSWELGYLAFYLFFASVGAMMNIVKAVLLSPVLFVYVFIVLIVHMVVVYGVGRLFKLDIRILTVASSAAKAGPPTVIALTQLKEWKSLVLPGIIMGLVGYALGNYLGFATAYLTKWLIGMW